MEIRVELSEKQYRKFLELCAETTIPSGLPITTTKKRLHGRCLDILMGVVERAIEIIMNSNILFDEFFTKEFVLKPVGK